MFIRHNKPYSEQSTISIPEFFASVKNSIQELEIIESRASGYSIAMKQAEQAGQTALLKKLKKDLITHRNETQLFAIDSKKCITETDLVHFVKQIKKGLGFDGLPWICSMRHINWPKHSKSKSLVNMALAHGVPVISAHRALTDCDILARMLTRTHELGCSLPDLMKTALEPRILVQAMVSYKNHQMAKDADFEWDHNPKFPKKWLKEVLESEISFFPFSVARMDNGVVYDN